MEPKEHWENVYATKAATSVSWFQEHAERSSKLIRGAGVPTSASILDVGGGASTLVDDLLAQGYEHLTVLDLSGAALAAAKKRLGARAESVQWIEADILDAELGAHAYDVWHDRAVFHFLIAGEDRRAYVEKLRKTVKPGGWILIATFAEDGPTKCSGLPVRRYSPSELHAELGDAFQLLGYERESHHTPSGSEQRFVYCHWRAPVA